MINDNVRDVLVLPRSRLYGKDKLLERALRFVLGRKSGPAAYLIDRCTYCNIYVNRIVRYIKENKINLVHLNNWPLLNDGGLFAAKKANIPIVMHVRGMEYSGKLVSWIAQKADHIIAISEFIKQQVLDLGVPEHKISVIPNAVDADRFVKNANGDQFKKTANLPTGEPIVGMAGCLVDWKGHKFFIEACAEVFKSTSAHGVIIGDTPNGSLSFANELRDFANKLGVLDRIHFVGHIRDISSAMDACDILVHASILPEPFGRVIIEGMALGKPVVATSPGGPGEIIDDKIDGLLVPPSNSFALAQAINSLLKSSDLRRDLGEKARVKIKDKYNVHLYADRVNNVYKKILGF
ncbi:MAG: glycosyltransferase family 4 protein [Desulfobulbus sp.]|nr:glycosyltransferase family 4 protein [Desulfobulbus sp.]